MRVLHVLAQLPGGTGSGVYFTNLIRQLQSYGHEQGAVFALQDDCAFTALPPERQFPVRFKTRELPFPVPGMSDVMPYDSTRYRDLDSETLALWAGAFRQSFQRAAENIRPEVLILHHLWMLTSLAIDFFPGAKSIGICHHTDLRQAVRNPELKERHLSHIQRLDFILSLSDLQQADIRRLHPGGRARLLTMGGGFDSALFHPPQNRRAEGPVKILYAGKIDPTKGVFALLEAFSALRKRDAGLRLSLVGTPNRTQAAQLKRMAEEIGGLDLYPALPQAELARAMREHDIFVLPSFFEGLGLIALEALACGLWTVATEIEGLVALLGPEVIQSGAIELVSLPPLGPAGLPSEGLMKPFVSDLAAKLERQAARVRGGEEFPGAVHADIARHSWEAIADRINALIT